MGHVILSEFHIKNRSEYFDTYCRQYNDMPMLVMLKEHEGKLIADRYLRASDLTGNLGQDNNPEWKTVVYDENTGYLVAPNGSIGFRWGQSGAWNLEMRDGYSEQGREAAADAARQPRRSGRGGTCPTLAATTPICSAATCR